MSIFANKTFFRLLGDFMHLSSKIILIGTIHYKRSGEGMAEMLKLISFRLC